MATLAPVVPNRVAALATAVDSLPFTLFGDVNSRCDARRLRLKPYRLTIFSLTLTLPLITAYLLFQAYLSRQSVKYIPNSNTGTCGASTTSLRSCFSVNWR